eukprot:4291729-Amphidinium_carterae.1
MPGHMHISAPGCTIFCEERTRPLKVSLHIVWSRSCDLARPRHSLSLMLDEKDFFLSTPNTDYIHKAVLRGGGGMRWSRLASTIYAHDAREWMTSSII